MRLEPDGKELLVGAGVGVHGGQPLGSGTDDFASLQRDDLKLSSGIIRIVTLRFLPFTQVIIDGPVDCCL